MLIVAINTAFILGGTVGGLIWSNAEPIYWLLEMPLAVLFCLTLRYTTTSISPITIANFLAIRAYFLLFLSILGAIILFFQLENWRQLVGFLGGCLSGLWLDWLQKFRRDRVVISWQGQVMIALKIISIFMFDISLMISGQVKSHIVTFTIVLVISQFFGGTLMELIFTNIRSVIGEPIPFNLRKLRLYCVVELFITFQFISVSVFLDNKLLLLIICAGFHYFVTMAILFQILQLKDNRQIEIEIPELEEIVVVMNPLVEGDINFYVGIPLTKK